MLNTDTATLSSLVYFELLYGADSYVDLNLAIYLPLLPISLAQARWDQYYDHVFQSRRTFLFRGLLAFALSLWGTVAMITPHPAGLRVFICNALLQGTGGAILYGTLNQLASFLGTTDAECSRSKATVSSGVQASALVVLLVTTTSGFGAHNSERFSAFLWTIAAVEGICMIMFLWLLLKQPSVTQSMRQRDSALQPSTGSLSIPLDDEDGDEGRQRSIQEPLLQESASIDDEELVTSINRGSSTFSELWTYSKSCSNVLCVTLVPSFLVGSWFTHVQTEWMRLPQILFYTRIAADFVGRLATILVPPKSIDCLRWTAFVRLVPVVLFFTWNEKNDMLTIALVATIAFLSGYLVTGCFQLAPQCLPTELRASNLSKQASLLTVSFSFAAICGLLGSFALVAIGF